jgi:serine/threonine protein kinase
VACLLECSYVCRDRKQYIAVPEIYAVWMRIVQLLAEPIGKGIAELHQMGILHRDLKPANILLKLDDANTQVQVLVS